MEPFLRALYRIATLRDPLAHEDRSFEGDVDLVKRGFLLARDVLRPYVV